MIESIIKAFKAIVKKPFILVPALIIPVVLLAVIYVFIDPLINLFIEAFLLENIPETPFLAFPIHFFVMYPIELLSVAVITFVSSIVWISTSFFYSRVAENFEHDKGSIGEAAGALLKAKADVLGLAVFFFVVFLFFCFLAWIFLMVSLVSLGIGTVLLLLLLFLGFYLMIKLYFTIPIMAIEKAKLKESLTRSWEFTNKRFWAALILLVVVMVISSIIVNIGNTVSLLVEEENISGIIFVIFWVVAVCFSNLAIAFYYLKKEAGK